MPKNINGVKGSPTFFNETKMSKKAKYLTKKSPEGAESVEIVEIVQKCGKTDVKFTK